jgi:hypothetical protein
MGWLSFLSHADGGTRSSPAGGDGRTAATDGSATLPDEAGAAWVAAAALAAQRDPYVTIDRPGVKKSYKRNGNYRH